MVFNFFNWSNKLVNVVKTVYFGFKTELVAFKVVEIFMVKKLKRFNCCC